MRAEHLEETAIPIPHISVNVKFTFVQGISTWRFDWTGIVPSLIKLFDNRKDKVALLFYKFAFSFWQYFVKMFEVLFGLCF